MRPHLGPTLLLGLFSVLLAPAAPAEESLSVAVSVAPLAELVERVGGSGVDVIALLPSGAAPETWAPTPSQALSLVRADLYLDIGHPGLVMEKRYLVPMAEGAESLERLTLLDPAAGEALAGDDPHLWMDIDVLAASARRVAEWLGRRQPERAESIEAGLGDYLDDLEAVDAELRGLFESRGDRPVVLQHPSWRRLLDRYGVDFVSIENEGKDPAPGSLVELITELGPFGIDTVFTQVGLADRGARLLASELGAELLPVDPLAHEWVENLRRVGRRFAKESR